MYEEFYGLKEKPFNLTPDPKYVFFSANFKEALDHLLYVIKQREGFAVLTGDIGRGKTTLCRTLLKTLDKKVKTALIFNPLLSELDLLRAINEDFGIHAEANSKKELIDALNAFLLEQLSANGNAILIIDEAQTLSPPLLEQLRILSNLETEKEKLLQIILVGQPELISKLQFPALRQLNQRISIRTSLRPLTSREVQQYIYHRLVIAGDRGNVRFTRGAARKVYKFSRGVPRLINLACDRALLAGYVKSSPRITSSMVQEGIQSLGNYKEEWQNKNPFLRHGLFPAAIIGLLLIILALILSIKWWPS